MALSSAHHVEAAGSLSGQIFLSSWLVKMCSFLAAFGVESVQPFSPDGGNGLDQLFAAALLARRDVFGALLDIDGRFTGQEVASCLLAALFCTSLW